MSRDVELTVHERLVVQGLLPEKSNFTNMKMLRELREELSFSAEELDLLKIEQTEQGGVKWDLEGAEQCKKVVSFNPHTCVMVIDKLKKLDETEELSNEHFTLYEKFVLVEDKKDEDEKVVGRILSDEAIAEIKADTLKARRTEE